MSQPPVVSYPNNPGWSRWIERLRVATAGRFTIIRELGRGGFAAVFLAQQLQPHRRVAIKLLLPAHLESQWALDHFRGESQKIAEWRHQSVVTIYEVHEVDDLFFFVMSYVEGASLHDMIQTLGPLPIPVVRSVLAQMGSALQYAHRQGVTHRDIKPQNVLIDVDGGAVVTDFGISKQAGGTSHTVTGMIFGTPQYIAPEQAETGANSTASDQYALGIVAYEMLAGSPPFNGPAMSVLIAHIEKTPPLLRTVRPDCPPELEAAVARMLAKKPENRFPSVAEGVHAAGAAELPDFTPERKAFAKTARDLASKAQSQVIDIVTIPPKIEVGEKISVEGSARTLAGDPVTVGTVQWSLDNKTVARFDANSGMLTALEPGSTTLLAKIGGTEQLIRVDVVPAKVALIQVEAPKLPLRVGERTQLRAAATSKHGVAVTGSLTWSSDDPALATISADGMLVAKRAGRARLRAQMEEVVSEFWIDVAAPSVREVRITGAQGALTVGDRLQLRSVVLDESDHELSDRTVTWTSSDRRLATVSAAGLVTASAPGAVMISATADDVSTSVGLSIEELLAARVELQKAPGSAHVGDRVRLRAVARDAQGNVIARPIVWSSADTGVAHVEPDGTVTAVSSGRARITATADGVNATTMFEVAAISAAPVGRVSSEQPTVRAPAPPRAPSPPPPPVPARVAPAAAPAVHPAQPLATPARRSSKGAIVGAGGVALLAAGIFLAIKLSGSPTTQPAATEPPPTVPTATSDPATSAPPAGVTQQPQSQPAGSASVTSTPTPATTPSTAQRGAAPPAATLRLAVASSALLVGDTISIRASASDGSTLRNMRWTSSDPAKAIVSASGQVRAVSDGAVVIVAHAGTMADSVRLDVRPKPVVAAPATPVVTPVTPPVRDSAAVTRQAETPIPTPPAPDNSAANRQVRQLVSDYAAALTARQLPGVVRLYPTIPKKERDEWSALFDIGRDLKVVYRVDSVDVAAGGAVARVTGQYTFTNRSTRRACEIPLTLQIRTAQSAGAWRITDVESAQGPTKGC